MPAKLKNFFLESLSPESRSCIVRLCVDVDLPLRKPLYEPGETPRYAFFMTSGIASVVALMEDGAMAEVGLIGHEGVVGSMHLLGPSKVSTRCFIQLEATAMRIRFVDLMEIFRTNEEVRDRVLEFVQEQAVSLSQLAGCNRLHDNEERLARWLLMAQDRTDTDVLNFTQEFLGMMVGARRTTVTLIAGVLQRSGLIKYRRGKVWILDREKLEEAACDCYKVTKDLYAGLYRQAVPVALEMMPGVADAASRGTGSGKAAALGPLVKAAGDGGKASAKKALGSGKAAKAGGSARKVGKTAKG